MNSTKLRIMQDYISLKNDKPENIFVEIDQDNIFNCYALIIGPKNTPYFGGFYFFEIIFPTNYPYASPKVKMLTTNKEVRFNPNLYECGKVCLSILGTWQGPGWSEVMNLKTVLLSIQSLLGEFPIVNEPGYEETKPNDDLSIDYNHYITYYNYKISILEILDQLNKENKYISFFKNNILEKIKENYKNLHENLLSYQITIGIKEINPKINKQIYFIRKTHNLDFLELVNNFNKIIEKNELILT